MTRLGSAIKAWTLASVAGAALAATAATPIDEYRRLWQDPQVERRIADGIEENRKSDLTLRFVDKAGRPAPGIQIEAVQQTHEFLFGCNLFVLGQLKTAEQNRKYEESFVKLFNQATLPIYWADYERTRGQTRYAADSPDIWRRPPTDRFVTFCEKHHLVMKTHPLIWHLFYPDWADRADEVPDLLDKRFKELARRYADSIPIWEVVNESLRLRGGQPDRLGKHVLMDAFGQDYERKSFQLAVTHFPKNRLGINELTGESHRFDGDDGKQSAYYRQIRALMGAGARIDYIGFQFHMKGAITGHLRGEWFPPNKLLDVYELYATIGPALQVTEITIPDWEKLGDGRAIQAEVTRNLYRLWFSVPKMECITWWNMADGMAIGDENLFKAGVLDENLDPKPVYKALDQLIHHEWKTKAEGRTDDDGTFRFRGFRGEYAVKVFGRDGQRVFKVRLSAKGPATQTLVVE